MYYLLSILAGIGTGAIFFLMKDVTNKTQMNPQTYTFMWGCVGTIVFLPGAVFSIITFPVKTNLTGVSFALFAAICFVLSNNNIYKAFKTVELSSFTVVFRLNMIIAVVGGILIFEEVPNTANIIGIFAIFAGILVIFLNNKIISMGKGGWNSIASAFFVALAVIFNKLAIENSVHPLMICFLNYSFQVPFVYRKKYFNEAKQVFRACFKEVIFGGILVFFSWAAYIIALKGEISIVQPIFQAVQLMIAVWGGVLLLNERENLFKKGIGFAFSVIGVILLHY